MTKKEREGEVEEEEEMMERGERRQGLWGVGKELVDNFKTTQ